MLGAVDVGETLTRLLVCCIYHAPKENIDESSEESGSSSSSSSSDESESGDDGAARRVGGKRRADGRKHRHGDECGHGKKGKRAPSPNAYEKMPQTKQGGGGAEVKKA